MHARCVPLSLIIGEANPNQPPPEGVPPPVQCTSQPCVVCNEGVMTGMYLFPLSLSLLDRAVELKKQVARAAAQASNAAGAVNQNGKRQRELDNDFHEVQAESSYLLLSHSRSSLTSTMSMETDLHRTGRWTSEEIAFVDFLLSTFDQSMLTLPHGIKLNEFLGDVLLCKSSRLTKKMKNARLSTRSYVLRPPSANGERLDTVMMSKLQDKFLQSLSNEPTQLELLFNLTKLWRTHFSNLCLQVGYTALESADWVASLEAMERRAAEAEEMIRKARRKRMGLALKTDAKASNPGVFFANQPVQGRAMSVSEAPMVPTETKSLPEISSRIDKSMFDNEKTDDGNDEDFISNMLELSSQPGPDGRRNRLLSMDLDPGTLDDLFDPDEAEESAQFNFFEQGPFLKDLISFLETNHLPFVHVDVWVPSYLSANESGGGNSQVRLFHAGYATREDVSPVVTAQFNEFGEYSKKFSFAPGVGLPGKIYESSSPLWFNRLDQMDPKLFERSGGAKVYGVKTVLGLSLKSGTGKIVVAMYTMSDIQRNEAVIDKCAGAFSSYSEDRKWRLVVEMGKRDRSATGDSTVSSEAGAVNDNDIDFSTCFDDNDDSGLTYGPRPTAANSDVSESRTTAAEGMASNAAEEEQRIATLLGEYMPLSNSMPSSAGEPSVSATGSPDLLNEFMQLRLLLLRPRSRRTAADNELIDVLRKSFHGYSNGNRRSGSELATLLVNDWRFLRGSSNLGAPPRSKPELKPSSSGQGMASSQSSGSLHHLQSSNVMRYSQSSNGMATSQSSNGMLHQNHSMDSPRFNVFSRTGGPTKRPSSLGLNQTMLTTNAGRRTSFDNAPHQDSQRRISLSSEVPDSPRSDQLNLVNP